MTQLAELLRTRQVTSLEMTEMYLDRLKRYDSVLECVACFTEDLAYDQAKRADDEISRGLPIAVRCTAYPGAQRTCWRPAAIPPAGAPCPTKIRSSILMPRWSQRLEEAGAVHDRQADPGRAGQWRCLARWHHQESLGYGGGQQRLIGWLRRGGSRRLGRLRDRHRDHGFHRLAIDALRRFRLAPTFGRVSRYGAMALSWSMDKIGPMCRSVEDCALVFSAIYGPDGRDMTVTPHPFEWKPALDPRKLRVAYVPDAFETDGKQSDDEDYARANLENSLRVLDVMRDQGFELMPIKLPQTDTSALSLILVAESAAAFDAITRDHRVATMRRQDDNAWPNTLRAARFIPAVEYINANRVRTQLMRDMAGIMSDIDVFIVPSHGGNAMGITNFTGHPTVVVPDGFSDKRTPTSISFIGGLYGEAETLAVAKAYQDATDWHMQHPALDANADPSKRENL